MPCSRVHTHAQIHSLIGKCTCSLHEYTHTHAHLIEGSPRRGDGPAIPDGSRWVEVNQERTKVASVPERAPTNERERFNSRDEDNCP